MSAMTFARKTQAPSAKAHNASSSLRIGKPDDAFEREADRVADEVISGRTNAPQWSLSRTSIAPPLQRKCACGGEGELGEECEECAEKKVQRKERGPDPLPGAAAHTPSLPVAGRSGVESSSQPLDRETAHDIRSRFGFDLNAVRIHTDARAAESAEAIGAIAYTTGRDIVFGAGRYQPRTTAGRRLLAHELAHVVQQSSAAPVSEESSVSRSADGSYRIAVGSGNEPEDLEHNAEQVAAWNSERSMPASLLSGASARQGMIQRVRVPVPRRPLCGKTLTHIDVLPPATKDLEPCLPKGVPVTRINVVGRDLTKPTPGMGNQVFNLHVGYYRDSANHYCGVVRDSKSCIAPPCLMLGCFPTLREVLDAILSFLKKFLIFLGVVALAILIAIIVDLLAPILVPAAELASTGSGEGAIQAAGAVP
jgi:hypothetical protein